MNNASSDTIDDVDGENAWISAIDGGHRKQGLVQVLVEEVTFLPEDCW